MLHSLNLCYNLCYVLTWNHLNAVYILPFIYLYHLLFPVHADEDTALLWAMSLDHYAQFLLKRGHFQEAFNQFQSAFLTNCELQGDTHPQSIVLLNSMGKQPCSLSAYLRRAIYNACFFFWGILGLAQVLNFLSPWATTLAVRLNCSSVALPSPEKVL